MPKQRIPLECAECLNSCIIQTTQIESISFCPFCGEALVIEFDENDTDDKFFSGFSELDTDDTDDNY